MNKKLPKEKDDPSGSRTTCRRSPSRSSRPPQGAPDARSSTVSSDAATSTTQSMKSSAGGPSSSGRTGTVMVPVGQKGLQQILEGRQANGLPTIYTTNLGAQDLVRCLDKRLVSRIVGTTYPVHFGWGDWRKSKPLTLEEAFGE